MTNTMNLSSDLGSIPFNNRSNVGSLMVNSDKIDFHPVVESQGEYFIGHLYVLGMGGDIGIFIRLLHSKNITIITIIASTVLVLKIPINVSKSSASDHNK